MTTTRIFLVRHGETEWNVARRIQGQVDVPLNEGGRRQAECLAGALAGAALAAIYASDLSRAVETAEAIAAPHGLTVIREPALRELGFGKWEGLDESEVQARYPEAYRGWREDSLRHRPPGGETIPELRTRVAAVYRGVLRAHAGQSVLLVAHGGPIRVLVLHALDAPLGAYPRLRTRNASLSLIEVGKPGPVLRRYNHVCFLA
ncbi:MAG: histidine phosphatase family protein [Armatimonadetes bacterium]|nr:histidine phosphatase family protein [Armatimonadota bacterium]